MITPVQHRVYEFIKSYIQTQGYSPTLMEIADHIGVRSKGLISRYVHALEKSGYLDLVPNEKRNIKVKKTPQVTPRLPLLGRIAAGQPIEAISSAEPIDVIDLLIDSNRAEVFALEVKGDSMIEEGIFHGDIVWCEKRDTASDGEIVVALIDRSEATLKRFYRQTQKKIMLVPANVTMKPLVLNAERVQIQGVFRGLIRLVR